MTRKLVACGRCEEMVFEGSCACPHCGLRYPCKGHGLSKAALALSVFLSAGCPVDQVQADYTAAATDWEDEDDDGDGWTGNEGDCDDGDASIYPGAEETPGDNVDSNCDGYDNT